MGIFDKVRVPLAFERKNKFTMTPITTCSQDWFSLRPCFSVELPPNSDISVSHSYYARLSPLQKPILGSGRVVNRAFFVPYRTIMPGFDDFIADTDYNNTYPSVRFSHVPYCKQSMIVDAMILANCAVRVNSSSDPYDFAYPGAGGSGAEWYYYKFNEKGRQVYSILTGLGYSLNFGALGANNGDDVEVSLMKILAYFRIVADWYVNNEFLARARDILQNILYIGRQSMAPDSSVLTSTLASLFTLTYYSNVDNDYFSTASTRPVTPTGASAVQITDVTNDNTTGKSTTFVRSATTPGTELNQNVPSTPSMNGTTNTLTASSAPYNLTQYVVDALAALTSYMQRNNIVGHKTLDRFKSRFGVTLSADKLDRSYYLGSNQSPIGVDEVMSNADTDGAALGAYAGRGSAGDKYNRFRYNNDTNSFGVFIILSTVLPDIHYGQGISRDNLHINRFDFLTPEMDALGFQAIARAELWNDAKTVAQYSQANTFKAKQTFGLQPTYSEYCRIPDILAGDFRRIGSLDLRAFHLYRMFSEHNVEGSPNISDYKTISENFVAGNPSEFNKIFNYTGTDWDHFYFVHSFHVQLVMPKKRLVDTYEFHDDNEGRPVSMPYKGTKLN